MITLACKIIKPPTGIDENYINILIILSRAMKTKYSFTDCLKNINKAIIF